MASDPMWALARVLPNLSLPPADSDVWTGPDAVEGRRVLTLESEGLAIAPPHDARLAPFLARFPIARRLIEAFRNETAAPARPSVMIVRSDSSIPRRTDVIAAFRNAVAMCFVLRARAATVIGSSHQASGSWSDLFDFHIVEVDKAGQLQAHSPALLSFIGQPPRLHLAPSPVISRNLDIRFCDVTLTHLLAKAWRRLYLRGRRTRELMPVFRSLEIAYQAASVPHKNVASLYDFGITIAHWVGALEALLWPVNQRASRDHSVEFFGQLRWLDGRLQQRRYRIRSGKTRRSVAAAQKAVDLLYIARNAFLHGERFRKRVLVPFPHREEATLPGIAGVLFRAALVSRLRTMFPGRRDPLDPEAISAWWADSMFENALLAFFGHKA